MSAVTTVRRQEATLHPAHPAEVIDNVTLQMPALSRSCFYGASCGSWVGKLPGERSKFNLAGREKLANCCPNQDGRLGRLLKLVVVDTGTQVTTIEPSNDGHGKRGSAIEAQKG